MAENRYAKAAKEDEAFKKSSSLYWECNVKTHTTHHRGTYNIRFENEALPGVDLVVKKICIPNSGKFYKSSEADRSLKKDRVILHYTAGLLTASLSALTIPDHSDVSVAYVLGRDGTVYKLFDDEYWAYSLGLHGSDLSAWGANALDIEKHSVAIEIINVGWLKKSGGNLYQGTCFDDAGNLKPGQTPYCAEGEPAAFVQKSYRDQEYYATYTDAQYIALKQLLLYLTAKYNIPYKFIEESKRYEKFTAKNDDWNGIVSHVNFRDDRTSAHPKDWGKWDIGPAFEWDRLLPGDGFRFPLNLNASLVDAGELKKNSKLLSVTQENIDAYYKHVEKETKGGFFPLGENTVWHGGVHLFAPEDTPVLACADGEVIAARLEKEEKGSELFYGSRNFVLLRHRLDRQTIRQLYCLWVPMYYTVKDPTITSSHHGQNGFKLKAGDMFARADDPPSKRTPFSEEGKSYPVKLASIAPGLEIVRTLMVAKKDVVLRGEPVVKPGDEGVILPLVPGDVVTLVEEKHIDDFNAAKANGWFHVKLTSLANIVAITQEYKVSGDYLNFRTKAPPAEQDEHATADDDRLGDLYAGDVLELVDVDKEGGADDTGWRHVKVKSLGAGKDVAKYTLKVDWSFRAKASSGSVLMKLHKGDVVELVQKYSRVEGNNAFDLVQLSSLVSGYQVADSYYTVSGAGTKLYPDEDADTGADVAHGTKLDILEKADGGRVHVRGPSGEGWIDPAHNVTLHAGERTATEWCKALVGTAGFVDALDAKHATVEAAAGRGVAVGDLGVIGLPHKAFGAEGEHRPHLHVGEIGKEGYVHFAADNMTPDGAGRPEAFHTLLNTDGTLTFTKAKLEPEQRDIPPEIVSELLANPVYYSLYMHLNNHVDISASNEKLKDYPWLPRTQIASLKLETAATLYQDPACSIEAFDLLKDDVLTVTKGGKHMPPVYQVKIDTLVEADIVSEIDVKGDLTLWMDGKCIKRALGLRNGDKLRPARNYNDEAKVRHVEIVSIAPAAGPAIYRVKKAGKVALHSADNLSSKTIIPLLAGDELVVVDAHCSKNKSNQWEYVRIKKLVDGVDKKKQPVARSSPSEYGYVLYLADALEDVPGDRNAELASELSACGRQGYVVWGDGAKFSPVVVKRKTLYKDAEKKLEGYYPFRPGAAVATMEPDEKIIERLKKGDVVGFGVSGFDKNHQPILKYPVVNAGSPLWGSGKYGPPDNRKDLIHWEIFSEVNLLPKAHLPLWTEAVDDDGDYNMDCQAILDLIEKGTEHVEKDNWESIKESVLGDMKSSDKVETLYQKKEVAEALRHYSCQFVIEWGIDLDTALPKLQRGDGFLAKYGIAKTAEGYQTTKTWVGGMRNRIKPLLWWDEAKLVEDEEKHKVIELPGTKKLWHYNPIAYLEAYSELDLEKQKNR
ncbi:MAG TPA: N-acetylmuramoyl-L-alanine amidase [Tepidisphaeraceae bacterium]|nr:N-acetylmuramoyl-L-alanine amidase [Tepidisphaeraceae bacterium]